MNVSLTERCYDLLRREAPVASDLRFVVSVLRVLGELERIGDLALRVIKLAPDHELLAMSPATFDILVQWPIKSSIVRLALRAWATMDVGLAAELASAPRSMEAYYERLMADLLRSTAGRRSHRGRDADGGALRRAHRRPCQHHRRPSPLPAHRRPVAPQRRGAVVPDTRRSFHHQLDEVQADLLRLGALVLEALTRGTDVL